MTAMRINRIMWMIPRCIRKIEPVKLIQVITLLDSVNGMPGDQSSQDALYKALEDLGVKSVRRGSGIANAGGFRTYLSLLECLGFFAKVGKGEYVLTLAGERMIKGDDPQLTLRVQLLRLQYPSVYSSGAHVAIAPSVKVRPFLFLIDLMKDPRICSLSSEEAAIAVVYGRSHKSSDFEKCIQKIQRLRSGAQFSDLIDSEADLATPRRRGGLNFMKLGCRDALDIGNTFINYLKAANLVQPKIEEKDGEAHDSRNSVILSNDSKTLTLIDAIREEKPDFSPIDLKHATAWQLRFGRADRKKDTRNLGTREKLRDASEALVSSAYWGDVKANPLGFNHESFVRAASAKYGVPVSNVEAICAPFKTKVHNVERAAVEAAAVSGGGESRLFEIAVCNIFSRLGFKVKDMAQAKPVGRMGGYPDVFLAPPECGFVDAKSSARYSFSIGDENKLKTYYHNCETEIDPNAKSGFFVYVAGGFGYDVTVQKSLSLCRSLYGRPVSAVCVRALLDLLERKDRPDAMALAKIFKNGVYISSVTQLVP